MGAPPSGELILLRGKAWEWGAVPQCRQPSLWLPSRKDRLPPSLPRPCSSSLSPFSFLCLPPTPSPRGGHRLAHPCKPRCILEWKQLKPGHSTLLRSPDPRLGGSHRFRPCKSAKPEDQAQDAQVGGLWLPLPPSPVPGGWSRASTDLPGRVFQCLWS